MSIDPRLLERRQVVAEDRARRNVGRLLRFLVVVAILGAGAWLMLSPIMSVHEVRVVGVTSSDTYDVLAENELVVGRPMILTRAGSVVAELETDPWVSVASIDLDWPNRVVVRVEERVPAAWVQTSAGWSRRTSDGVALPSAPQPDETLGWARLSEVLEPDAAESAVVLGAIEFISGLPDDLRTDVIVRIEDNGEMWAVVSGYQIRLGRPVEMTAKALSLAALLEVDPPLGAVLTLIAPTHPAVTPVRVPESGEEETSSDVSGDTGAEPTDQSEGP
jgi:cell division protein FtsQ